MIFASKITMFDRLNQESFAEKHCYHRAGESHRSLALGKAEFVGELQKSVGNIYPYIDESV
jgi:hypothetical protein